MRVGRCGPGLNTTDGCTGIAVDGHFRMRINVGRLVGMRVGVGVRNAAAKIIAADVL